MERQITITVSDEILQRASGLASLISRPVEDVLSDTLAIALPDFAAEATPPMRNLSDNEVLSLAQARLASTDSKRLSYLLDRQQRGLLQANERTELLAQFQAYMRLWLRQSEALVEAKKRNLSV